jgi:hypothetical protein
MKMEADWTEVGNLGCLGDGHTQEKGDEMRNLGLATAIVLLATAAGCVREDYVAVGPTRKVLLTIYESSHAAFVSESRTVELKAGRNNVRFSWGKRLIDPTSIEMLLAESADGIRICELTCRAREKGRVFWQVESDVSAPVPVDISYLTGGLSWEGFYVGTLSESEDKMRLEAYIRISNKSGGDFENALVRIVAGRLHTAEGIGQDSCGASHCGGSPEEPAVQTRGHQERIGRQYISSQLLFPVGRIEAIPAGWSKRLPVLDIKDVPVVNIYRYDHEQHGSNMVRLIGFKNDQENNLGDRLIPGGQMSVYKSAGTDRHMAFLGKAALEPVVAGGAGEINLGPVTDVVVDVRLMDLRTENFRFDRARNVSGYDEVRRFSAEVQNARAVPIRAEIRQHFDTPYWKIQEGDDLPDLGEVDGEAAEFVLVVPPKSTREFDYVVRTFHGENQSDWAGTGANRARDR